MGGTKNKKGVAVSKAQWNQVGCDREMERVRKIKRALYMRNYRAIKKAKLREKTPVGIMEKIGKELAVEPMDIPIIYPLVKRALNKHIVKIHKTLTRK